MAARRKPKTRTVYRQKKVNLLHMVAIGTAGVASAGLIKSFLPNFPTYIPTGIAALLLGLGGKKYLGNAAIPLTVALGSMAGAELLLTIPQVAGLLTGYGRLRQVSPVSQIARSR